MEVGMVRSGSQKLWHLNSCNRHANREIYGRSNLPALPMRKKAKSIRARSVHPRFRILRGGDIALGPGKVELLALIGQTGSINKAARRMGMSYMRAWSLVSLRLSPCNGRKNG